MILKSPYSPQKVVDILKEQLDGQPTLLSELSPFSIRRFRRRSDVCGIVKRSTFVIRNTVAPSISLIAKGKISQHGQGSLIDIEYSQPAFAKLFPARLFAILYWNRFKYDREIIEMFLNEWLKTKEINT